MGHRLSKIYTRTGDAGTTGLSDGSRIDKDAPRVAAMGSIDELNSFIGLTLTAELPEAVRTLLINIQHELFDLGGELSMPNNAVINEDQVKYLETQLDQFNSTLEPLKEFILPGGTQAAAYTHLARAVCRRAERETVRIAKTEAINPQASKYLNRLSDLLFVVARLLNKQADHPDVLWNKQRKKT